MHLSETRGPDERRASLQSCSVLGEVFCVSQNKMLPAYTPYWYVFQALVCWERQFITADSDLLGY